jgi:DNA-binding MarR family transcriptional regulator
MKAAVSALNPIFRSDTQGRLLATLMADPDRDFSLTELASRAETSPATSGREIDRLEAAGVVRSRRAGNTRMVMVDRSHPRYRSLAEIVTATWGVPAVIAEEFAVLPGIEGVVIFGSWAARWSGEQGRPPNDIDVLVLGDPDRGLVDEAAERAEKRLRMPVQAIVRRSARWGDEDDPFLTGLRSRPIYEVVGLDPTVEGRT